MPVYQIHFKNRTGDTFAAHEFECMDDEQAAEIAHEMHDPEISHGFELRHGTRVVRIHPPRD